MLDNINEGNNSSTLLNVACFLLIFSFAIVQTFPMFVLETPEEDPTNSLYYSYRDTNSSSSDLPAPDNSISSTSLLVGIICAGFIFTVPLLAGSWKGTHKVSRIVRSVFGLLCAVFYFFILFRAKLKFTQHRVLPFYEGLIIFMWINAATVGVAYIFILLKEFTPLAKKPFKTMKYHNLVRRLLKPTKRAQKTSTISISDEETIETSKEEGLFSRLTKKKDTENKGESEKSKLMKKKKENNHKPFEKLFDAFFPQRLIYSTAVSFLCLISVALGVTANLLQFGKYYLPFFFELFGLSTSLLHLIQKIISYAAYAALIPFLVLVVSWIRMFVDYRRRIFRLRQGIYDFDPEEVPLYNAPKFMGTQIAISLISYLMLFIVSIVIIVVVVLCIVVPTIRTIVVNWLINFVVFVLVSMFLYWLHNVILRCLFVTESGALKNRRIFYVYDYIASVAYILTGVVDSLSRLKSCVKNMLFTFPRMDAGLYASDEVHHIYLSVLYADHHFNNPILVTFLEKLTESATRGKSPRELNDSTRLLSVEAPDITRSKAFYRARNRWCLARILLANPSLRKYRKQNQ